MPSTRPLDGQRFGRLTIIRSLPCVGKKSILLVHCDCGKEFEARRDTVTNDPNHTRSYIRSCGCLNAERIATRTQGMNSPENLELRRQNGKLNGKPALARFRASTKGKQHMERLSKLGGKVLAEYRKAHPEATLTGQLACPKKDTKLELAVKAVLDTLGLRYEHPFNLHDHFLVDFYLPESNIIIEADGCYWHGCRPCGYNNGKDARTRSRNAYIKAHGYNLIVVPEHEAPDFPSLNFLVP